jgi:hypothetical protein
MGSLTRYRNDLPTLMDRLQSFLYQLVRRQTVQAERLARQYAPIVSGNLVNSSASEVTRPSSSQFVGEVAFNAHYASYVNFGTGRAGAASDVPNRPPEVNYGPSRGRPAKPYLSLAITQSFQELVDAIAAIEREL